MRDEQTTEGGIGETNKRQRMALERRTNDRGWRFLEFAKSHRLALASALHPHKLPKTATWHAPNGQVHNQIDFTRTPHPFKSRIDEVNAKSFPGADIGSDHDLVLTTIKLKLKTKLFTKSPVIRFDLEKFKDPKLRKCSRLR